MSNNEHFWKQFVVIMTLDECESNNIFKKKKCLYFTIVIALRLVVAEGLCWVSSFEVILKIFNTTAIYSSFVYV